MGFGTSIPQTSQLENTFPLADEAIRRSSGPQYHRHSHVPPYVFFIFAILTTSSLSEAKVVLIPAAAYTITESGISEVNQAAGQTIWTESLVQLKKDEENGFDDRFFSNKINLCMFSLF